MMMEQQLTLGDKMLHGFLKIMVACLIVILALIPIAGIAHYFGLI